MGLVQCVAGTRNKCKLVVAPGTETGFAKAMFNNFKLGRSRLCCRFLDLSCTGRSGIQFALIYFFARFLVFLTCP